MKKYILPVLLLVLAFCSVGSVVHANVPFFLRTLSATATSTLSYMAPGTGTTTLTFDAGVNQANGADMATLLIQYTASSTAPTLRFRQEFSTDNVDWYTDGLGSVPVLMSLNSTSTQLITPYHEYQVNFATTTDFGGSGTFARSLTSLQIPTPTRYTRIKFYVPASGGNGALWAEIVGKKQTN